MLLVSVAWSTVHVFLLVLHLCDGAVAVKEDADFVVMATASSNVLRGVHVVVAITEMITVALHVNGVQ